jgi:DivIVA domain-containing protein
VTLVWVLLGIVVLGGVAVVAAGRGEGLPPAEPDRPDLTLSAEHPLLRADVDAVRFSVGLRGYRMEEVDDVLDRVAADLEERDVRIAALEELLSAAGLPVAHARSRADDVSGRHGVDASDRPSAEPTDELAHAGQDERHDEHHDDQHEHDDDHDDEQPDEQSDERPDEQRGEQLVDEEDDQPRVSRTMIVPIAAAEPTQPDGPAGA